jgi:hypothetical protein
MTRKEPGFFSETYQFPVSGELKVTNTLVLEAT